MKIFQEITHESKMTYGIVAMMISIALLCALFFIPNNTDETTANITMDNAMVVDTNHFSTKRILHESEDDERLLYDDSFLDFVLETRSIPSVMSSLNRISYARRVDCHQRAHEVGRRVYELFGNEAFKQCSFECHSGCIHGATEAFFAENGASTLAESMKILCGTEYTVKGMNECLHGVGHGLMAWHDYELYDALKSCDILGESKHRDLCYSGVFMENIVGSLEGFQHATKYLNDDPHYPCNAVDDHYKVMCYDRQPTRMRLLLGLDAVLGECETLDIHELKSRCFFNAGRTSVDSRNYQKELDSKIVRNLVDYCARITDGSYKENCLIGTLASMVHQETDVDNGLLFCSLVAHSSSTDGCYRMLIRRINIFASFQTMSDICKRLPIEYREQCVYKEEQKSIPLTIKDTTDNLSDIEKTENAVIRYIDGEYIPDTVHISIGSTVTWINNDQAFWVASNLHPTHAGYPGSDIKKCSTQEKETIFDACEAMGPGETYSFTFNEPGQWRFHDHINPQATGTVIVSL